MSGASKVIYELLDNGVHFGHQTNRWNPKMEKYIFGQKSGVYIIDLIKTEQSLRKAMDFLLNLSSLGKKILFTGTKKQAKRIIKEEAKRCKMFFVDERWLGGCFTNFSTIRKSVDKLNQIQQMKESEVYDSLVKKEKAMIDKQEYKLLKNFGGIREMDKLPDCLVVVDTEIEDIAVKEANKLGIPIVALIDTNSDPDMINYPIPGNDDAIKSIKYVVSKLADAIIAGTEGKLEVLEEKKEEVLEEKEVKTEEIDNKEDKDKENEKQEQRLTDEKKDENEEEKEEFLSEEEKIEGDIRLDNLEE